MALQLIPKRRTLANPSLVHLFSTASSSSSSPADSDDQNDQSKSSTSTSTSTSGSPFSSSFSDINASLRRQQPSTPLLRSPRTSFSPTSSFSPNSKAASLEESRKNLSEFRSRSEANSPAGSSRTPLFRDLYKQKVLGNAEDPNRERSSGERLSFQEIFGSLKQMRTSEKARTDGGGWGPRPLSAFKSSLRFKPSDSPSTPPRTTLLGGTDLLPQSVFGKEIREKTEANEQSAMKTEFVKMYTYKDLGEKLKILRPDRKDKGEGWFSMEELNERLARLRAKEEKEADSRTSGQPFRDLRNVLLTMKLSSDEEDKKKKASYGIMGLLRTPEYMKHPPKEHLVEKYFHLDNMSSAEKMKIELAKVREEFKMSESDCGSARVQVAQLTTKIKHLSAVLHKKDKHSRKGLLAMVQRRKRLLKYLRRSDWDSYCFVLDKLGLRDNPDLKN